MYIPMCHNVQYVYNKSVIVNTVYLGKNDAFGSSGIFLC